MGGGAGRQAQVAGWCLERDFAGAVNGSQPRRSRLVLLEAKARGLCLSALIGLCVSSGGQSRKEALR